MKVFFIIIGVIALLVVSVIGAGWWWLSSNEEKIRQLSEEAALHATQVAQSGDSLACVDASKQRIINCKELVCQVTERLFLESCLDMANYNASMCDSVKNKGGTDWALEQCPESAGSQVCAVVLSAAPDFCSDKAKQN
ncbi:hypothetical protein [Pleionea sediminis]|uniref:hypothetical protein n=1 Tax=Pleionea sediminis TaxID=2569479 RepID=UPI0011854B98|nr:hypothetical protein [Pleionea sediminis]